MEFLKSLVPTVGSVEASAEDGTASSREPAPRLLRMKRLGLLAMGHTIEEDVAYPVVKVDPGVGFSKSARSKQMRFRGTSMHRKAYLVLYIWLLWNERVFLVRVRFCFNASSFGLMSVSACFDNHKNEHLVIASKEQAACFCLRADRIWSPNG